MKGDKYKNLYNWLKNNSSEKITLSFSEIEEILGFDLPNSAKTHTEWWSNDSSHSQAVWLDAGYKTVEPSVAISTKKITFEKDSHSPKKKDRQCKYCAKTENMDLNDVVFKPWRNGTECNSTGYGLCVSREHARLFPREWTQVIVEVVYQGKSEILYFNLNDTFWTTCPDIKNARMGEWFEKAGIVWQGEKPKFETVYLEENKFRIVLG